MTGLVGVVLNVLTLLIPQEQLLRGYVPGTSWSTILAELEDKLITVYVRESPNELRVAEDKAEFHSVPL
jgi:hypothetical protein